MAKQVKFLINFFLKKVFWDLVMSVNSCKILIINIKRVMLTDVNFLRVDNWQQCDLEGKGFRRLNADFQLGKAL